MRMQGCMNYNDNYYLIAMTFAMTITIVMAIYMTITMQISITITKNSGIA